MPDDQRIPGGWAPPAGASPSGAPAPQAPPAWPPPHGGGPAPPAGGHGFAPPPAWPAPAAGTESGKAIAALVLGICGLIVLPILCSIAGLVLGYRARREIDRSGGALKGRGSAVAGIVLGWIGIVVWGLIVLGLVLAIASGDFTDGGGGFDPGGEIT